jgi:glycosyltransferase involved in cell wall biosynthesis
MERVPGAESVVPGIEPVVPAVELVGYLSAAVGVGEAARRYVWALRSAGVPVSERDVPLPGRDGAQSAAPAGPIPAPEAVAFNLLCLNPEQMVPYLDGPEAPPREGRTNIGIWSWEVDVLPPGWREAAGRLAEVWTYSRFSAELIGAALDARVLSFPPPLSSPAVEDAQTSTPIPAQPPTELLPGFRVLVRFDYLSTLERKNPLGAIEAYCRAFQPDDGAVLVLKSVNGRHRPERHREVLAAVEGRPDVVVVDRTTSDGERDALIAGCDCYLSLHRSEGHGLPLAEAMSFGKLVVATAYGGNMEFMSAANSYPVAWNPVRVEGGVEHYPAGASWAEPDLEDAVRILRTVRDFPEEARSKAGRARADVRARLAPEAIGSGMSDRLQRIHESQRPGEAWRRRSRYGASLARRLRGR